MPISKQVEAELREKQQSNREQGLPVEPFYSQAPCESQEFEGYTVNNYARGPPKYITVPDWPKYFSWPPNGGLRHIIFNSETNGFAPAIKRVGRRVLIDSQKFWEIVEEGNG